MWQMLDRESQDVGLEGQDPLDVTSDVLATQIERVPGNSRPRRPLHGWRWPTLTWPREIPIEGEPADVAAIVAASADWLATSDVPKLFVKGEPGGILAGGADLDFVRRLPSQTEVTVAGIHYVQEDSPHEIGRAIAGWMGTLG